jgi:Alcohol dehydrogenase GroES-like domain/WD40-like Beta Propeller Repeat
VRAVVHDRYGPPEVLRLEEVERPVPAADEVLVEVHATSVTRTDCGWRSGTPFFVRAFAGIVRPRRRILGMEFAGAVTAVGAAVRGFRTGDEVFGVTSFGANAQRRLTRNRAEHGLPAWSPNGRRIASGGDGNGNGEIYVMNADGGAPQRLTRSGHFGVSSDAGFAWRVDSQRLAAAADTKARADLAEALRPPRLQPPRNRADEISPAWSL